MLKDRRVLLEQEIEKLTKECGQIYLDLITNPPKTESVANQMQSFYQGQLDRLTNMKAQLNIINHLIEEGKE